MPRNLSPADIARFQDRLCDVAEPLFAEHGAEAVTIRQLADAVGVSPMTPYRYFKDRDAILAAVRDYMVDLGNRVVARRKRGEAADAIVTELGPVVRAEHPDWSSPEWIDFAIRYYASLA